MAEAVTLQDLGLAVKKLQWRHHRDSNSRLATVGLSLPQWDVLRHLHQNPGASLHDLAVLTFQTDQSMGTLATRMIDRGMLKRVAGPGRAVRHRLTSVGEDLRVSGARIFQEVLEESFCLLTQRELDQLHALVNKALGPARTPLAGTDPARPDDRGPLGPGHQDD